MFYEVEPRLKILGIELRGERVVPLFRETPEGISVRKGWMNVSFDKGSAYFCKEFRFGGLGWRGPRLQVLIPEDVRDTVFVQRYERMSVGHGWVFVAKLIRELVNSHYATDKRLRWIPDTP